MGLSPLATTKAPKRVHAYCALAVMLQMPL
jgi:hypothetical protein